MLSYLNLQSYGKATQSDSGGFCSTHATSNLGIWLNGKIGLYLEDLANPKDNADLAPNCL
jgi:hypothetical protein